MHPLGAWYDAVYDVHEQNRNPAWADPGLAQEGGQAPGPEVIVADDLPPGLYQVGAAYRPAQQNVPENGVTIEITIACGGQMRVIGPQQLTDAINGDAPAEFWQAATIRLPECDIQPFPRETRVASTLCFFGFCVVCIGCQDGVCRGVDCPDSACDLRDGTCIDPCEDVACPRGQACSPRDLGCYATGAGQCDPCQDSVQCTADGTDRCLVVQATGERFCGVPCADNGDCDRGYTCQGLVDAENLRYCGPDALTCVDRCAGVQCPAGRACDPLTGMCAAPRCALNTDCGANQYCDRGTGQCGATGMGQGGIGAGCDNDAQCAPGTVCVVGFQACARVCDVQEDCPGNQLCFPELFNQGRLVCASLP
ncbi:MAG: hypothetical protein R3F43_23690 [bacterium]